MDSPIKNNKEFIFNLIQRGKEAGMIWNCVSWVPAGADGKPSKVSKGPKITEVSRVSKKTSPSKSFTKIFESIGNEISSIKNTLNAFVKGQEKLKKKADEEKLKEKNVITNNTIDNLVNNIIQTQQEEIDIMKKY